MELHILFLAFFLDNLHIFGAESLLPMIYINVFIRQIGGCSHTFPVAPISTVSVGEVSDVADTVLLKFLAECSFVNFVGDFQGVWEPATTTLANTFEHAERQGFFTVLAWYDTT